MKNVIIVGTSLLLLYVLYTKKTGAVEEGIIVPYTTNVYGDCNQTACVTNSNVTVISSFKNIGTAQASAKIGIMVDDIVVKEEYVTLVPGQEYFMSYDLLLDEIKDYNVCSVVI
jgi:hypothetical protein